MFGKRKATEERPPGQIWIFFTLESPMQFSPEMFSDSSYNYTASYRRDSVLVTPYEKYVKVRVDDKQEHPQKDYASGKNKSVAWFASNCLTVNGRREYVEELRKYIDVDIYGRCGELDCSVFYQDKCFEMLNRDYKFYLAFENSNCVDYITEKFFINGLRYVMQSKKLYAPTLIQYQLTQQ